MASERVELLERPESSAFKRRKSHHLPSETYNVSRLPLDIVQHIIYLISF